MKKKNLIRLQDITFGTIAVSSLFVLFGASGANATTSSVDSVSIEVPVACTMTSTVNTAHTATANVGTYQENIGETTFNVICNDANGFAVYAIGYSDDTYGNTTMKPSTLAVSNAIATGTATSGNTSNWAMKLTAVSGDYAPTLETGFNAYHAVPAEYTKVVSYSSNTDSSSGSSFKSTYAAFVASAQPADTYTGKVKYTVVHPANAETPGMKISQLTYMQDFHNLSTDDLASVKLSMSYNTTYSLIDNRDNRTYQIAKLKDGNIWMAENLDLGGTTLTQDLTSANTSLIDPNATITASTFNTWIKTSYTSSYISAIVIPVAGTDSASNTPYGTIYNYCAASAGTFCTYSDSYYTTSDICPAGWRLPTGGDSGEFKALYNLEDYNTNAKMRAPIADGGAAFALASSSPSSLGLSGGYWPSTTAGSSNLPTLHLDTSSVNPTNKSSRTSGLAARCIAKKPRFLTVSYGAGVSNIQINGITVPDGEKIELEEGFSYPITMTPSAEHRFVSWSVDSGTISSTNNQSTNYNVGNSDAVLTANTTFVDAPTIQNLSSSGCTTTASYAKDNRDGHVYIIQRLADGKCWMMENLDLGRTALATDLTASNTNLTNTITAATFNGWKKTEGTQVITKGEFVLVEGTDSTSKTQYGTLYNYCAVSAGTICSSSGANNDNAASDLCPAGWRLPTGGNSGEFNALYNLTNYNSNAKMRGPIANNRAAFALVGYFESGIPIGQGSSGRYWSSTRNDGSKMYTLQLDKSNVTSANNSYRQHGCAVRCVTDI